MTGENDSDEILTHYPRSPTTSMAVFRNGIRSYLPSWELYGKSKTHIKFRRGGHGLRCVSRSSSHFLPLWRKCCNY